jgi:hypothetical protein
MRLVTVLLVALVAAAPTSARLRPLHRVAALPRLDLMSDGVSAATWQTADDTVTVWSGHRVRTVPPPPGACGGPDAVRAMGAGRVLFWCGPDRLIVMNAATGATRTVVPDREIGTDAYGQIPTVWTVGRSWVLLRWPDENGSSSVAEVETATGAA